MGLLDSLLQEIFADPSCPVSEQVMTSLRVSSPLTEASSRSNMLTRPLKTVVLLLVLGARMGGLRC